MDKKESLIVLQECRSEVENMSDEDVNRMRDSYEKEKQKMKNSKEYMENANTVWYDEDIKTALEERNISVTEEIIAKIASKEFVKSFHETLVSYGNEMIADRIYEVFGK